MSDDEEFMNNEDALIFISAEDGYVIMNFSEPLDCFYCDAEAAKEIVDKIVEAIDVAHKQVN